MNKLFWRKIAEDWTKQCYLVSCIKLGFPGGSDSKESAWNAGYLVLIPGLRRSPGGRHDNPLPYFCLENPHGQRILASYSPWGHKELDMTEQLNWIEWAFFTLIIIVKIILVHTFYKVNNSIRCKIICFISNLILCINSFSHAVLLLNKWRD